MKTGKRKNYTVSVSQDGNTFSTYETDAPTPPNAPYVSIHCNRAIVYGDIIRDMNKKTFERIAADVFQKEIEK